jgi:membrane protease YdiL (CAAX protease family)
MKTQISVFDKIKYTTIIIFKIYILVFILFLISELIDALVLSVDFSKIKSLNKKEENLDIYSILWLSIKVLIISPVSEEIIFRKPVKGSKMSNVILIIVFTYSIISLIFTCDLNFYFLIFYSILVLAVNYLFNKKKVKLYSINLIITSVIFGLFHVNNFYLIDGAEWYIYAYKIFPMIILGFGLGMIRLKLNVIWSIVGHSLFNLFPFFLTIY